MTLGSANRISCDTDVFQLPQLHKHFNVGGNILSQSFFKLKPGMNFVYKIFAIVYRTYEGKETIAFILISQTRKNFIEVRRLLIQLQVYSIKMSVPTITSEAPTILFQVNTSPKNKTDKTIARATLNLSTGATWETFPNCNALK